jgi:Tfp pilus assembly protein PilN
VIAVNLLPKEERSEELRIGLPRLGFLVWVAGGVGVILLIGGSIVVQQMKVQALSEQVMIAEMETAQLQSQVQLVRSVDQHRQDLMSRLSLLLDLSRGRSLSLRLVDEIAAQIPGYLWLTRVKQLAPDTELIEGVTFSNLIVADLMTRLSESDLYETVDLTVAERGMVGDQKVVTFSLTARAAAQTQ